MFSCETPSGTSALSFLTILVAFFRSTLRVEFFLAEELPEDPPLVLAGRRAAEVDLEFLEGFEVQLEVEAVVAFLGQDQFDLVRIEAAVVGLSEQAARAPDHAGLHVPPFAFGELPRHQHVAVGIEQLVGLVEVDGRGVVLLLAPVGQVLEELACFARLAWRPCPGTGQAVDECGACHRQEGLAEVIFIRIEKIERTAFEFLFRLEMDLLRRRRPGCPVLVRVLARPAVEWLPWLPAIIERYCGHQLILRRTRSPPGREPDANAGSQFPRRPGFIAAALNLPSDPNRQKA
jgi:hypothetical protein